MPRPGLLSPALKPMANPALFWVQYLATLHRALSSEERLGMKDSTLLTIAGRNPVEQHGCVNAPVYRTSTVLFPTVEAWDNRYQNTHQAVTYGTSGTPTTFALANAVSQLEGGFGSVICSSGLAAVSLTMTALLQAGDHMLMTDSVYGPGRSFSQKVLKRYGVETTFYDPMIGEGIAELIRPNTKLVYMESPGTFTFEVQDVPAITRATHEAGALAVIDNTWSGGLYFKPFEHGVDVSIQAGTKYQAGHSDLVIGWAVARDEELYTLLKEQMHSFGDIAGPDECALTLRGLRTMAVRMEAQNRSGLEIADWLAKRPEVAWVRHPALPGCPGHELWKRDFSGSSSLFGFLLDTKDRKRMEAFVANLKLCGLGASWGGYQSLVIPAWLSRDVRPAPEEGILMRLHVGLEDVEDLKEDSVPGVRRNEAVSRLSCFHPTAGPNWPAVSFGHGAYSKALPKRRTFSPITLKKSPFSGGWAQGSNKRLSMPMARNFSATWGSGLPSQSIQPAG